MVWFNGLIKQIDSIIFSLTNNLLCSGCPRQLYLLRMFWTWFFQMFFNKSLIKFEKFVSCLMQYSKKYWKWPETYVLILHSYWTPQFQNFAIPPIWLSSHSIWLPTQRHCYPCITFSLHNFKLLPKYPTYVFSDRCKLCVSYS